MIQAKYSETVVTSRGDTQISVNDFIAGCLRAGWEDRDLAIERAERAQGGTRRESSGRNAFLLRFVLRRGLRAKRNQPGSGVGVTM